ncbi:MAG: hypothetical protein RJA22_1818 [Verrucomicrobiota bacterium]|jgi:hypothetical protein
MRLIRLSLVLAAFGLSLAASRVAAQDTVYVRYTNSWRYFQTGDQGTDWRAAAFDDSSWGQGLGLFYAETTAYPAPFITPLTAPNVSGLITTYFRTRFNFSGSTNGVRFNITNYVDDGMIAYLNGVELFRYNMPAGAVTFTTQASVANPAGEPNSHITNVVAAGLIAGQNVLAVEVHQNGTASSDVVFGMSIGTLSPPVITSQPQSQTNVAGSQTVLCVGATGASLTYQWQKDNGAGGWATVAGATFACYTNATPVSAAGNYRVVVSNPTGSATSQVATLTVLVDNVGPLMSSALLSEVLNTNQIVITFNEKLTGISVTTNNFSVWTRSGGATNPVTVESAFYNSGTIGSPESSAVLRVGGPNWNISSNAYRGTINYYIIANNIRDISGNTIAPNSTIGVSFPNSSVTNVIDWNANWEYHIDWANPFNEDPTIYLQAWNSLNYSTVTNGHWGNILGVTYKDAVINPETYVPCRGSLGQECTYVRNPTLFRTTFVWPTNAPTNGLTLRLQTLVDDGAVIYLNGNELLRVNVAAGTPVNEFLRSATEYADGQCASNNLANISLRHGTNLLAVAVAQNATDGANGGDIYWGARMDILQTGLTTGAVPRSSTNATALRLLSSKVGTNQVRLSWWTNVEPTHVNNLYNYTVVYATNITRVGSSNILGPNYQLQPGVANGMVTNFNTPRLPYYFRLQRVP